MYAASDSEKVYVFSMLCFSCLNNQIKTLNVVYEKEINKWKSKSSTNDVKKGAVVTSCKSWADSVIAQNECITP